MHIGPFWLILAVLLAGCASPAPASGEKFNPFPEPEWPHIYVGGLHPRWESDGTMTGIGYAINKDNVSHPPHSGQVTLKVFTELIRYDPEWESIYPDGPFFLFTGRGDWKPGQVIPFEFRYSKVSSEDLLTWRVSAHSSQDSAGATVPCFRGADERVFDDPYCRANSRLEWDVTPEREETQTDLLLGCCNWLPPPFDIRDLSCGPGASGLACSLLVRNWKNVSHEAAGAVVVEPVAGEGALRATSVPMQGLGVFGPGEERAITVAVPAVNTSGVAYQFEARVWRAELETSVVNATATLGPAISSDAS